MINNDKNLSAWLPPRSEESSGDDPSLKIQEKAVIWLGADLTKERHAINISTSIPLPLEKKPQISNKIGT